MEKIKWPEKVTNERIVEKRTFLNNILSIGHILRRNCLLHDVIGQMTEVKGVRRRRRTQALDNLGNRRY